MAATNSNWMLKFLLYVLKHQSIRAIFHKFTMQSIAQLVQSDGLIKYTIKIPGVNTKCTSYFLPNTIFLCL